MSTGQWELAAWTSLNGGSRGEHRVWVRSVNRRIVESFQQTDLIPRPAAMTEPYEVHSICAPGGKLKDPAPDRYRRTATSAEIQEIEAIVSPKRARLLLLGHQIEP